MIPERLRYLVGYKFRGAHIGTILCFLVALLLIVQDWGFSPDLRGLLIMLFAILMVMCNVMSME